LDPLLDPVSTSVDCVAGVCITSDEFVVELVFGMCGAPTLPGNVPVSFGKGGGVVFSLGGSIAFRLLCCTDLLSYGLLSSLNSKEENHNLTKGESAQQRKPHISIFFPSPAQIQISYTKTNKTNNLFSIMQLLKSKGALDSQRDILSNTSRAL